MKSALFQTAKEYNEAILQRIRVKCVENNTSIPKIEKALGYGNGSISGWKNAKKRAPMERVEAVAGFLGVSPDYLIYGKEHEIALDSEYLDRLQSAYEYGERQRNLQEAANGTAHEETKKAPAESDERTIANYELLSDTNKAIVDRLIADLLEHQ